MKLYLSSLALMLLSSADAFAPMRPVTRQATFLASTIQTSEEAVTAAKEASDKFGATSKEARVAWELVEEIDSAISHEKSMKKAKEEQAAAKAALEAKEEPCAEPLIRQDNSEAVKMALEASKMYGTTSNEARMAWDIVEELDAANARHRPVDIHATPSEECTTDAPAPKLEMAPPKTVEDAIYQAKMASDVWGKHSSEARIAWEMVEEMDSTSSHKAAAEKAKDEKPQEVESKLPAVKGEIIFKDASEAIAKALAASKEHGPTSVEARMAWELVEEIDAANSHHKTVGSG